MNTLTNEIKTVKIKRLVVSDEALTINLNDGRTVAAPLAWYPRLLYGKIEARTNWRIIGDGEGIHWPDLDEDISVENLLMGKPSGESQRSFKRWLEEYMTGSKQPESSNEEVVV